MNFKSNVTTMKSTPFRKWVSMGSLIVITNLVVSCKVRSTPPASSGKSKNLSEVSNLNRCVAIRGNGTHLIAHTTALAKLTLRWGEIQALAGGSSATISAFLYESVLMNPEVQKLQGEERAKAIAFLLKSIAGFASETLAEKEWMALRNVYTLASTVQAKGVFELKPEQYVQASNDLNTVMETDEFKYLVNPEIFAMLANKPEPAYKDQQVRVSEVKLAVASLTALEAVNPDVFVRPGVLNFPEFIRLVSRVGDFYAGYGPAVPEMSEFIKTCSAGTEEKLWSEFAGQSTPDGACGERFTKIVQNWKAGWTASDKHRLDDPQGLALPTIMITSILQKPSAIKSVKNYEIDYHKGTNDRKMDPIFDDLKFGYWVSNSIKSDPIAKWISDNPDGKSKKAINLGSAATWREILEKSPREPSLGKYTEFAASEPMAGSMSLGGWADLHPVQVLKAAGCEEVIYVTRRTEESGFISKGKPFEGRSKSGLAEMLGMTEAQYNDLYNLQNPKSGFSIALSEADGVWCTDWNRYEVADQFNIAKDGFTAPLLTKNKTFLKWPEADLSDSKIVGCR